VVYLAEWLGRQNVARDDHGCRVIGTTRRQMN
jgi:hypothetical protein